MRVYYSIQPRSDFRGPGLGQVLRAVAPAVDSVGWFSKLGSLFGYGIRPGTYYLGYPKRGP